MEEEKNIPKIGKNTTLYYKHEALTDAKPSVLAQVDTKFAIIKLSGSQLKVRKGDIVTTHKIKDKEAGDKVEIKEVLLVGSKQYTMVGVPYVEKATVFATVEQQTRGGKVMIFKMKRRKGYRRTHGEAPYISVLHIDDIVIEK